MPDQKKRHNRVARLQALRVHVDEHSDVLSDGLYLVMQNALGVFYDYTRKQETELVRTRAERAQRRVMFKRWDAEYGVLTVHVHEAVRLSRTRAPRARA